MKVKHSTYEMVVSNGWRNNNIQLMNKIDPDIDLYL